MPDDQEMIYFIKKYWDGSTDNDGQIIIYTSMREDKDGNIVALNEPCDNND